MAALEKPLSEILGRTDFDFFAPELAEKYRRDDMSVRETRRTLEVIDGPYTLPDHLKRNDQVRINKTSDDRADRRPSTFRSRSALMPGKRRPKYPIPPSAGTIARPHDVAVLNRVLALLPALWATLPSPKFGGVKRVSCCMTTR